MAPPYAAPPGWQPPPPPYGAFPAGGPSPSEQPYAAPPGWGQQQPYGQQQPSGQQPWGNYHPGYGYYPPQGFSGFAIAGFVCALVLFWFFGLGGILGVVFGILGIRQCARENRRGRGLAIAAIVIGGLVIAFWVFVVIVGLATSGSSDGGSGLGANGALTRISSLA
jgi:Domain of unknown function (DUF4190)